MTKADEHIQLRALVWATDGGSIAAPSRLPGLEKWAGSVGSSNLSTEMCSFTMLSAAEQYLLRPILQR